MPEDDERRRLGKEKMAEIAQLPEFDPPDAFTAATTDQVFGELWQRRALGTRDRRLVTIGILASRGLEMELGVPLWRSLVAIGAAWTFAMLGLWWAAQPTPPRQA